MSQDSKSFITKAVLGVAAVGLGFVLIRKFFTKKDETKEDIKKEVEDYDKSPYLADKTNGNLQLHDGWLELELIEKEVKDWYLNIFRL